MFDAWVCTASQSGGAMTAVPEFRGLSCHVGAIGTPRHPQPPRQPPPVHLLVAAIEARRHWFPWTAEDSGAFSPQPTKDHCAPAPSCTREEHTGQQLAALQSMPRSHSRDGAVASVPGFLGMCSETPELPLPLEENAAAGFLGANGAPELSLQLDENAAAGFLGASGAPELPLPPDGIVTWRPPAERNVPVGARLPDHPLRQAKVASYRIGSMGSMGLASVEMLQLTGGRRCRVKVS